MNLRKAIVTGGTRGIGLAIADKLSKDGWLVTITGTRPQPDLKRDYAYLAADLGNIEAVERLTKEIQSGHFSLLVNNAGINKIGPVEDYSPIDFERIQKINLEAPFRLCQAAVPWMKEQRWGRIINISSIFGHVSRELRSAYSASKSGLVGLTKALSLELAPYGVLVNCVSPGFVETDLTRSVLGEKGMETLREQVPMKRLAQPSEIAELVGWLASDKNTYLTGQNVLIDGGFTCQ